MGWYRVFGATDDLPSPADIEASLASGGCQPPDAGSPFSVRFTSDADGWFRGELTFASGIVLELERWLADEEGIRGELNSWAGFLETCEHNPHSQTLMERTIQTRQLFTLHNPVEADLEVCLLLCQFLAERTAGFYQVDGQGFFAADGTLLVPTPESP